ncbi:hypothetical protein ACU4GD_18315 [Cupriavidus basilensis]
MVAVKSPMEQWALAMDRVRYVGEPVAVVMAESRALAEDALDLVRVNYRVLPPVVTIEAALADDTPILHPGVGANVVSDRHFRATASPRPPLPPRRTGSALTAHYPRNTCTPIECGVVVCRIPAR